MTVSPLSVGPSFKLLQSPEDREQEAEIARLRQQIDRAPSHRRRDLLRALDIAEKNIKTRKRIQQKNRNLVQHNSRLTENLLDVRGLNEEIQRVLDETREELEEKTNELLVTQAMVAGLQSAVNHLEGRLRASNEARGQLADALLE